ncbi:hypothetical protein DKX38_025532 [Salix brachista]|uniref:HMA domain-containing protein n=1 Tax=Salix brachista TaxID=2182728 RepID=A0A5N5JUP4_9ROSI|nr:hypothetical protein DKX38_025532 [Salix brachista]
MNIDSFQCLPYGVNNFMMFLVTIANQTFMATIDNPTFSGFLLLFLLLLVGVYSVVLDAEQGTVKVNGKVNPTTILNVFDEYGKHGEVSSLRFDGEVMEQIPYSFYVDNPYEVPYPPIPFPYPFFRGLLYGRNPYLMPMPPPLLVPMSPPPRPPPPQKQRHPLPPPLPQQQPPTVSKAPPAPPPPDPKCCAIM